jgi:arginine exporter protein ArgO
MGIMQQLGARATLLTVNMITLIFSCILIFYGTTGIGPALRERPCVFSSRQAASVEG